MSRLNFLRALTEHSTPNALKVTPAPRARSGGRPAPAQFLVAIRRPA